MKRVFLLCLAIIILGMIAECRDASPQAPCPANITASWYSIKSTKKEGTFQKYKGRMANGELFNEDHFVCASWDYDFETNLRITNLKNGKSIVVRVADRGPNKELYKRGRIIDLSRYAFSTIADLSEGVISITVKVVK